VTVLYNPASQRRRSLLAEAQDIFLRHRSPATPVGLVRNAYRPGQSVRMATLGELPLGDVDMLTVVVIGSSQTAVTGGRMVTKRAAAPGGRRPASGRI
jgi:precorrin-3B methylase